MARPTELLEKVVAKTNGEAGKPLTLADQVKFYLQRADVLQEIKTALPKHLTPERLARLALTTIRQTPGLMNCNLPSLMGCLMQSAQLGLEPGPLGHCYFIPYGQNCQFIIGYKGLLDLARRSGDIITIAAGAIYSNDKFVYKKGFNEVLEHEPNFATRGDLIGFYAYATTKDGGRYADVMTLDEVNRIRERSRAKNNGPWVTDFEEMGKKTVVKRLAKYLPLSVEIASKFAEDDQREFSDATEISLNVPSFTDNLEQGGVRPVVSADVAQIDFTEGSSDV